MSNINIHLAKESGSKEVMDVLHAVNAANAAKRAPCSHLHPLDLLNTVVHRVVNLALHGLEKTIHHGICRLVTCERHKKLQVRWYKALTALNLV